MSNTEASTHGPPEGQVLLAPSSLGGRPATRVAVTSELDIASVAGLDRLLRRAEARAATIVLDLRDLEFIDASGVQLLAAASHRIRQAGRRLVVVRGCPEVQWFLALTGLDKQLEIVDQPPQQPALAQTFASGAP